MQLLSFYKLLYIIYINKTGTNKIIDGYCCCCCHCCWRSNNAVIYYDDSFAEIVNIQNRDWLKSSCYLHFQKGHYIKIQVEKECKHPIGIGTLTTSDRETWAKVNLNLIILFKLMYKHSLFLLEIIISLISQVATPFGNHHIQQVETASCYEPL